VASIREIALKIKAHGTSLGNTILGEWAVFILVILAVIASFGLGRLSVLMAPEGPILVQNTASAGSGGVGQGLPVEGQFVGSKTGEIYYFPWCSGALKIPPESRVWFMDEKAAAKEGYRPAGNCKGMSSQ
jgi:hypothetical protein